MIDEATRDPDRASETRAAFVHIRACQEGPQESPQGFSPALVRDRRAWKASAYTRGRVPE